MSKVAPLSTPKTGATDVNPGDIDAERNVSPPLARSQKFALPPRPHPIRATDHNSGGVRDADAGDVHRRKIKFMGELKKKSSSEESNSRSSVVDKFRQSLKMVKDSTEKNEEVSEIERKRRQSLEVAFSAKGATSCMFASFRAVAGRIATSAKFAKLMILTHILNAFTALAALHAYRFDSPNSNTNLTIITMILLGMYAFETCVKLISLDRGYFYYWMNTWDSLVFAVAITLLIDTGLSNFAFVIVLVFRSVRHLEAVLNVMKAIHLMIRLLNGETVHVKQTPSADVDVMPYHTMARLLAKAKFTARFTDQEIAEVDTILTAITSNKLFAPNIDRMLSEMGSVEKAGGAEFAGWIKQNFTAQATDAYSSPSVSLAEVTHHSTFAHGGNSSVDGSTSGETHSVSEVGPLPTTQDIRKAHKKAKASWNRPTASPCVNTPTPLQLLESSSSRDTFRGTAQTGSFRQPLSSNSNPNPVLGKLLTNTVTPKPAPNSSTGFNGGNINNTSPQLSLLTTTLPVQSPARAVKLGKSFRGLSTLDDSMNAPISARAIVSNTPKGRLSVCAPINHTEHSPSSHGITTLPPLTQTGLNALKLEPVVEAHTGPQQIISPPPKLSNTIERLKLDMAVIEGSQGMSPERPLDSETGRETIATVPLTELDNGSVFLQDPNVAGPTPSIIEYLNAEGQLCGSWQAFIYPVEAMEPAPKLPSNPYTQYLLTKQLNSWGFNTIKFSLKAGGEPLAVMFRAVLDYHSLPTTFSIPESVVVGFGRAIEAQYMKPADIPYHNSDHATDVLQSTHALLTSGNLGSRLNHLDTLSLLIAAAAHDVGHPGVNNSFLINTEDNEAVLRNDQSVLEHMHAFICFNTMRFESQDILGSLKMEQRKHARSRIIALILGTDLQQHFDMVCRFKTKYVEGAGGGVTHSPRDVSPVEDSAGLLLQMQVALKIADISHPTKPWELHSEWTRRCMNEFFQQGDREKAAGLPTSALMDRVTTKIPQAQLGFINVLVRPLLSAWTEANQKGLWDTASASPVTNTVVHTPFHAWPSPVTAGASSGSGNVTLAGSVRNMGLALCKTIEGFLNANAAQWQAMEESGSSPSLDITMQMEGLHDKSPETHGRHVTK